MVRTAASTSPRHELDAGATDSSGRLQRRGRLPIAIPADAERIFPALAEGGTVLMPLEKTFWAARFGMLVDRFGVKWMINCEGPDPAAEG